MHGREIDPSSVVLGLARIADADVLDGGRRPVARLIRAEFGAVLWLEPSDDGIEQFIEVVELSGGLVCSYSSDWNPQERTGSVYWSGLSVVVGPPGRRLSFTSGAVGRSTGALVDGSGVAVVTLSTSDNIDGAFLVSAIGHATNDLRWEP